MKLSQLCLVAPVLVLAVHALNLGRAFPPTSSYAKEDTRDDGVLDPLVDRDYLAPRSTATSSSTPTSSSAGACSATPTEYINGIYYGNWAIYGRNYKPRQLPVEEVTHVFYGFGNVEEDGTVVDGDPQAANQVVGDLFKLKDENRNLKILLSIGGWTYSDEGIVQMLSGKLAEETGQNQFVQTAVDLMVNYGFDGLDIDIEYPENSQQGEALLRILEKCRERLDEMEAKSDYHHLLTVASTANPDKAQYQPLAKMDRVLDFWNLMAYDYAGGTFRDQKVSGHQANLYTSGQGGVSSITPFSTEAALQLYNAKGVCNNKILLGLPLYGRAFEETTGPAMGGAFTYQPPESTKGKAYEVEGQETIYDVGVWPYKDLPRGSAVQNLNEDLVAAWTWDATSGQIISHDNPWTTKKKAAYIKNQGLLGAFFWMAGDDKAGEDSLVHIMYNELGTLQQTKNRINYPLSQFVTTGQSNSEE